MKKFKNVLIIGGAVLLTAGVVGVAGWLSKGFTTADPISDLTKRGEVVQILEKTVDPLTHIATYATATADVESVSGGSFSTYFSLDDEDEFLLDSGISLYADDIPNWYYFSSSQGEKIAAEAAADNSVHQNQLYGGSYNIHEWNSTSTEDTKMVAFDTLRINLSLSGSALLVSSASKAEEAADIPVKAFAKVETITPLHTYIDIDMSEIGEDGYINNYYYTIVGLDGNAIPDVEIKSVELVNKDCAYDFVSYQLVA